VSGVLDGLGLGGWTTSVLIRPAVWGSWPGDDQRARRLEGPAALLAVCAVVGVVSTGCWEDSPCRRQDSVAGFIRCYLLALGAAWALGLRPGWISTGRWSRAWQRARSGSQQRLPGVAVRWSRCAVAGCEPVAGRRGGRPLLVGQLTGGDPLLGTPRFLPLLGGLVADPGRRGRGALTGSKRSAHTALCGALATAGAGVMASAVAFAATISPLEFQPGRPASLSLEQVLRGETHRDLDPVRWAGCGWAMAPGNGACAWAGWPA